MSNQSLHDEAKSIVERKLAEGFDGPDAIVEGTVELLLDEHEESVVRPVVTVAIQHAQTARAQAQRLWPAVTDCDRLDAAFEELNAAGIMARHHWWCCGNCGQSAMSDEFDRLGGAANPTPIIGYTFYHVQDTESATDGGGLYLSYGSVQPSADEAEYKAQSVHIAKKVQTTLESHGLRVDWDGTCAHRLLVTLNWQRRARPPRFCEGDGD